MTIRAKSRRRLLLLSVVAAVIVGGALGYYLHRERVLDEDARAARAEGLEAYRVGEHALAVRKLGQFIRRLPPDVEALECYATSILELPARGTKHTQSAVAALRRCIHMQPDNTEVRRKLLQVYLEGGVRTEAIELANWFLERDPLDEDAFRAKVKTLREMRLFEEARDALDQRAKRAPLHLQEQLLYLELMKSLKRPDEEILTRGDRISRLRPEDRRYPLIRAHAMLLTGDAEGARRILRPLASRARRDPVFARIILRDLDAAAMPAEGLAILRTVPRDELDPGLKSELIRRLWEAEEYADIPELIEGWGLEADALPTAVLGYAALAWRRSGQVEHAAQAVDVLAGRTTQRSARGWARLLRGTPDDASGGGSVRSLIDAGVEAVALDPYNPLSRFQLGRAYAAAGEAELAIRELSEAGQLSPTWSAPAALAASLLSRGGRLADAVHVASDAFSLGSRDPGVALLVALANARKQGAAREPFAQRVLAGLDERGLALEKTVALRMALFAALGRADKVRELMESILAENAHPDGEVLLGALQLSRRLELDLDGRILERYEGLHGNTPALALLLAGDLARRNGDEAGLASFRSRRARAAGKGRGTDWNVAEAMLLRTQGHAQDALALWGEVVAGGDAEPAQLRRILGQKETWSDLDLAEAATRRLREATGDTGLWWRYFEAKRLLAGNTPARADVDAALAYLKGILEDADEHLDARLLYAEALANRGRTEEALDQLIIARGRVLASVELDLLLARLHQEVGQNTAARDILSRVVRTGGATSAQRLAIASLLGRLGARKEAIELLNLTPDSVGTAQERLRRAELLAASGLLDRAWALVQGVLSDEPGQRALLLAAGLAELRGDEEQAQAMVKRVSDATPDSTTRDRVLSEHYARVQKYELAEECLLRITAGGNAGRGDWLSLLAAQMHLGRAGALASTLERARSSGELGEDGEQTGMRADLLQVAVARAELRPLGAMYILHPERRAVAGQTLRMLAEASEGGLTGADRARLRSLAQSSLDFLELQMLAVNLLLNAGDDQEALVLCRTALSKFPTSSEPARALAYCHLAMGRPSLASEAAKEWRLRAGSSSAREAADLFLAQLSPPAEAKELLDPYVQTAIERGASRILVVYGRALLDSGRLAEARELLEPHLSSSPAAAMTWANLAAHAAEQGHRAEARSWLQHEALADRRLLRSDVQIELAAGWQALAADGSEDGAREMALHHLEVAAEVGGLSARDCERMGYIYDKLGDREHSEDSYRAALEIDPTSIPARNNLAMLLARMNRNEEAVGLARALVAQVPDEAELIDTLAFALIQSRDLASALEQYERCVALEPDNPRWAARLIDVLIEQGALRKARQRLDQYSGQYFTERMSPQLRREWAALKKKLEKAPDKGK